MTFVEYNSTVKRKVMDLFKSCKVLLVMVIVSAKVVAATYTSTIGGTWGAGVGLPATGYWGGATDIVYIDHAITHTGNITFGGSAGYTLVIRNGGSLTVTGTFTSNNGTITIDNGGTFTAANGLGANNNSGTFTIDGDMNITSGGITQVANEWIIGSTGSLNITGNLNNDNSAMDMTVYGTVNVSGNSNFHSGSYVIASGGSFTSSGTTAVIGNANLVNEGSMSFPNATTVTEWSGSFDCDGTSTAGTVTFGQNIDCSAYCTGSTGSGTSGCYSNGSTPLPIELNFFKAKEEDEFIYFNWETLTEQQNDFFSIEYSYDAIGFTSIIDWMEGAGDSYESIKYEASYPAVFSQDIVYFRLKQTDYDGVMSYSDIVPVFLSMTELGVFVYPNPVSTEVLIQIEDLENRYKAVLVNPMGINDKNEFEIRNGSLVIDLSDYQEGVYFLHVNGLGVLPKKIVVKH